MLVSGLKITCWTNSRTSRVGYSTLYIRIIDKHEISAKRVDQVSLVEALMQFIIVFRYLSRIFGPINNPIQLKC